VGNYDEPVFAPFGEEFGPITYYNDSIEANYDYMIDKLYELSREVIFEKTDGSYDFTENDNSILRLYYAVGGNSILGVSFGTSGEDVFSGVGILCGEAGNDKITGSDIQDALVGGEGNDSLEQRAFRRIHIRRQ
jgi:Ca2+-binding RTX toxin-like protein